MMCWPFVDVKLADAPPPKPKAAEEKAEYVLVSDQLHLIPGPRTDDPAQQVYYASGPVPEPVKHNFWSAQPSAQVPESLKQNFWSAQPRAEVPESVKQNFWYGQTKSEAEAKKPKPKPKPKPTPVLQQVFTPPTQQFYCREIDGSYTLRSTTEIMTKLQPGFWTHSDIGYPYWVRTKP